MTWVFLAVLAVIALMLWTVAERLARIHQEIAASRENNVFMFYALEQIYEMSGIADRFTERMKAESEMKGISGRAGLEPAQEREVMRQSAAWTLLVDRTRSRVAHVLHLRNLARKGDLTDSTIDDPDYEMINNNSLAWLGKIPFLSDWPPYENVEERHAKQAIEDWRESQSS